MDYSYLQASDGDGDAVLMRIEADRLTGATTFDVDSVANVPAKFIATAGTLAAAGYIDSSTKIEFMGHLSSGNVVIDALEPGYTDTGNTEGQVIAIRPTTGWGNRIAALAMNLTNHGTPEDVTVAELTATSANVSGTANAANLNLTSATPNVVPTNDATDVDVSLTGKGDGRILAQLPFQVSALNGTCQAEAVLATLNFPAVRVATRVILIGSASVNLGAGAPTQEWETLIRKTNVSGTVLDSGENNKTAAAGVTEARTTTLTGTDTVAANTAATYVLTGLSTITLSPSGVFWGIQIAQ